MVRIIAIAGAFSLLIVGVAVFLSNPAQAAKRELLGGIAAQLRHQGAAAGVYHYGKATVTFDGKRVVTYTTPQTERRKKSKRK